MIAKREFSPSFVIVMFVVLAGVGGGINFVLSQGYLTTVQASNLSGFETMLYLGYDATDDDSIIYHDNISSNPQAYWHGDKSHNGINRGERIGVYVQNTSEEKITFREVRLGSTIYFFQDMGPNYRMTPYSMDNPLDAREYAIVVNGNRQSSASTIKTSLPVLESGQKATIVLELDQNIKIERDVHFKIKTNKGGVFVYTMVSGQKSG